MIIQLSRSVLLNSLQKVIGAIEKKQTMPILGHVLFSLKDNVLQLTGTDLEVTMSTSVSLPGDAEGQCALPARKLWDIVRALPDDADVMINAEESKALLTTGKSRFSLMTLPAKDFPAGEDIRTTSEFELSQGVFLTLLNKTAFAMANQDVRYYLNGLLLSLSDSTIVTVGTDGHRLAVCDVEVSEKFQENQQFIVPRKGVLELQKLLQDSDEPIKIILGNNHVKVKTENIEFTSKLIDGNFPDYERVIPQGADKIMTSEKQVLKDSLQRASILSNEKYRGIRLVLENQLLKINATNSEQESAEDEVAVQYEGETIQVGFNVQYLLDAINAVEGEHVEIAFKDGNSSVLIRDPLSQAARYIVMPMRL